MTMSSRILLFILVFITHFTIIATQTCTINENQQCNSISCGLDLGFSFDVNTTDCLCTTDDIRARFSECVDDKKSLFYYWRPPATCLGMSLPPPITDIPCSTKCKPGEFFNTTTVDCQPCPAGHTTHLQTKITEWNKFPSQMTTYCGGNPNCQKWRLQGSFIDSGNNTDIHGTKSYLDYHIEVLDDMGSLSFEYIVEGELCCDKLKFFIDGKENMSSARQLDWERYTIYLEKGYHFLRWIYEKDSSVSYGMDMAMIRNLELSGTSLVKLSCDPCPPGHYRGLEDTDCIKCPRNHFSDKPGQEACQKCPPLYESFEGATKCEPSAQQLVCAEKDYFWYYGSCTNNVRTKYAAWIQPILCNTTHPNSVPLPDPIPNQPCEETCQPGQVFVNGKCEYCQSGYYSKTGTTCVMCTAGKSTTPNVQYITKFLHDGTFTAGCTGHCRSNGWRMVGDYADSGIGNGISNSFLSFVVNVNEGASITFDYSLSCMTSGGSLDFWVDNNIERTVLCYGCNSEYKTITIPVPAGQHTIKVDYKTTMTLTDDPECELATIKKIAILGSTTGGAADCVSCPAGTSSPDRSTECIDCKAGTYSPAESPTCLKCKNNTFSYDKAEVCYPCGNGTTSEEGSATCTWASGSPSKFVIDVDGTRTFDWDELSSILQSREFNFRNTRFYFNFNRNSSSICGNSFACVRIPPSRMIYLGDVIDMKLMGDHIGFDIVNYKTNNCSGEMRTNVELICDAFRVPFDPVRDVSVSGQECSYKVAIQSEYGCPLCREDDWTQVKGECIDGKRKLWWQRKNEVVITANMANEANFYCTRGIQKQDSEEECTMEVQFPVWAVILAVIGFVVLVVIVLTITIVLIIRHKKLQDQYNKLIEEQDRDDEPRPTISDKFENKSPQEEITQQGNIQEDSTIE